MPFIHTTHFRRGKPPHWEVEGGSYFITVRLTDSLPRDAVVRLQEIHRSLEEIEARSEQFVALQRTYFRMMEKYLDAGAGACWLRQDAVADQTVRELIALRDWNVDVVHYTIMPNHWHASLPPVRHAKNLSQRS